MTALPLRDRCKVGDTVHNIAEQARGVVFTSCLRYFDWIHVVSYVHTTCEETNEPVNCIGCLPYV